MFRIAGLVALWVVAGLAHAATFTVTSTADTGGSTCAATCTLRQALAAANAAPGVDSVVFNIPGDGPHRITLASALPSASDVNLDGYTQPGAQANTHPRASNAVLKVIVDGRTVGTNMATFLGGSVRGLSIIGPPSFVALRANAGTTVAGCWFGVEPDGTTTVSHGNSLEVNSASTHTVGGANDADRNVFVASVVAVRFQTGATGINNVRNNLVGLLPNGSTPAAVETAISAIGANSTQSVFDNTISCTGAFAISNFGRVFERNRFGTTSDGISAPGCSTGRIFTASNQSFSFNTIGHYTTAPLQVASTVSGLVMRSNRIVGGTAIPFDLNNNGFTFNDGDDSDAGANGLQNYPTISQSLRIDDDQVLLAGNLRSTPNTSFALEFFASPEVTRAFASTFPLANAERVSTSTISVTTNAAGDASFGPVAVEFDGSGTLGAVVGTATRLDGLGIGVETSEYGLAQAVYAQASGDFVVTNTNLDGPGSLFRALLEAEARPDGAGRDRVVFAIPGDGPHTLGLGIWSTPSLAGKIEIDGYTQPGAVANTATLGSNAQLKIDLLDAKLGLRNADSLLRGLVLRGPSLLLFLDGGVAEGNFIGVSVDGSTLATTNNNTGQVGCDGPCRIGGASPAARNVIGCPQQLNSMQCVSIRPFGASGQALVEGNLIGVSASGLTRLVTPTDGGAVSVPIGIEVTRAFTTLRNNVIGGLVTGIQVTGVGNVTITGNRIGIGVDDATPLANARQGIRVNSGTAVISNNLIAHNGRDGVLISAGSQLTTLLDNRMRDNGELGVDLDVTNAGANGDGVSPNDLGDADTFANGGQNFPLLANARRTPDGIVADVSLNSLPSRQYRLRYCYIGSPDPSGHGECEQPAGVQTISTDASGNFSGTTPVLPATALSRLTVTAGRVQGSFEDTSEFAPNVLIADATATTLEVTPNPSVFGQPITVSVDVSHVSATPPGSITVSSTNGGNCTAPLVAGSASCQLTPGGAGATTVTASYSGAPGFSPSEASAAHTVTRAATTLTIAGDTPDPSTFGDSITVTFQLQSTPATTGSVTVSDGVGGQCSGTTGAGGNGSCVLTPGAGGSLTLTASYAQSANFLASADTEAHQVNAVASTLVILSDTPDPSVSGQPVNVAAQLTSAVGAPAGPIVISDGAGASCQIASASGNCNLLPINAGDITLRADFAGNATHSQSTTSTAHSVSRAATTLVPATPTAADGNAPRQFAPMRFPVTIAVTSPGSGAPSGSVTVTGTPGVEVCVMTLPATSCDLIVQTPGLRTFQVAYPGDTRFLPSASEVTVEVRPDFLFRFGFEEDN